MFVGVDEASVILLCLIHISCSVLTFLDPAQKLETSRGPTCSSQLIKSDIS